MSNLEVVNENLHDDTGTLLAIQRAEIDIQIATARQFPRSWKEVQDSIRSLSTLDKATAESCTYSKPQGKDKDGKQQFVNGPSIRFAEIVASMYGNCRQAARVISIDRKNKQVVAQGVFHDLERNTLTLKEVSRSIATKSGGIYSADMIVVAGNAACSIALRNAILSGVPAAVYKKGLDEAQRLVRGDLKTLAERRQMAVKAFEEFGVKPAQVYAAIGVRGLEDIQLDELMILGGIMNGIKAGDTTVEEVFAPKEEAKPKPQTLAADPADQIGKKPEPKAEAKEDYPTEAEPEPETVTEVIDSETGEVIEGEVTFIYNSSVAPFIDRIKSANTATDLEAALKAMFKDKAFQEINAQDLHEPIYEAAKTHPAWDKLDSGSVVRNKIMSGY